MVIRVSVAITVISQVFILVRDRLILLLVAIITRCGVVVIAVVIGARVDNLVGGAVIYLNRRWPDTVAVVIVER